MNRALRTSVIALLLTILTACIESKHHEPPKRTDRAKNFCRNDVGSALPDTIVNQDVLEEHNEPAKPESALQQGEWITPEIMAFIAAAPVDALVCRGVYDATLCREAKAHADYQALMGVQGHQGFAQRSKRLQAVLGPGAYSEICAESWPWQSEELPEQLAAEFFRCWRQSPGHWFIVCREHELWGGHFSRGRNGIWYACIIVKD